MSTLLKGLKPDITPAQLVGIVLFAGVPYMLVFLGVITPNATQQDALEKLVILAGIFAASDLGLRTVRNVSASSTEKMALKAAVANGDGATITTTITAPDAADDIGAGAGESPLTDEELAIIEQEDGMVPEEELPDDEDEFASPPPPA